MDQIHPILPTGPEPQPVERVTRRDLEEEAAKQREQERRRRRKPAAEPAPELPSASDESADDGPHIDVVA